MSDILTPPPDEEVSVPTAPPRRNTTYYIEIESPLLRPGMKITSGPVSEGYVVEEARKLLAKAREINSKG